MLPLTRNEISGIQLRERAGGKTQRASRAAAERINGTFYRNNVVIDQAGAKGRSPAINYSQITRNRRRSESGPTGLVDR